MRHLALAVGCALAVTACGTQPAQPAAQDQLRVVASFYPLEWLAGRLSGPGVTITGLTPVGTEPHDLVLSPRSRRALEASDVVLHLGASFQPDVERAVSQLERDPEVVDLLVGLPLLAAPADLGKEALNGARDPHVWLDPLRVSMMAGEVAAALVRADPRLADGVSTRLAALTSDLDRLDAELGQALADCRRRTIVTSHAAFGYLADRYDLEQIAIAGLSPDAEPDPATLRRVADSARRAGVTTVFFEEALPPDLARTVAGEIGASIDLLGALEFDPSAAVAPGEDYLSVMRRNGAALSRGLDCG